MTKVLTIDSEEAAVERMVKILESNDYQVQSATTWTEAVDAIAHGQPDLVLLDIEMPIVHGDVLLEFIREEGFEIPVIVVSFPVEEAVAKALLEQGVYGIVEKPYGDKTLIEKIEHVLDIAELEEDIESDTSADAAETEAAEKVSEENTEKSESGPPDAQQAETPREEQRASPPESTPDQEGESDSSEALAGGEKPSPPEPASDDEAQGESETFLKQPSDLRTKPRAKMSKRKKTIMFIVIGIYILIGGFIAAMYFNSSFLDRILSNW